MGLGLRATAIGTLVVCLTAAGPRSRAQADEPSRCPDAAPSPAEVDARLAWIERHVAEDEDDVRRWFGAFAVIHALLAGVQVTTALAATEDGPRIDSIVNATGGALGLVTLLASTPPILGAGDALRALPRDTDAARLASLRIAEARLRRHAEAASFVRSEFASLVSIAYVEAASLTLLALGRTTAALIHAAGGVVLGQGRLLLHPTGPIAAWRTYQARHPDAACSEEAPTAEDAPEVAVSAAPVGAGGAGVGLTLRF